MGDVFVFALTAALNPTLLAATTVMLLLSHPKKMLLGYLLGAMMTSVALGLVIVFAMQDSSATDTAQKTLSPAADLALGGILLVIAFVLGTGADQRRKERRSAKHPEKEDKGPPRWRRTLDKGSPRIAFVVGALLTLPGGSYIAGLHRISEQDLSTPGTVATVIAFNLIMMMLLEVPLIGYTFAPEATPRAVDRFKAWVGRVGRRAAVYGAGGIGLLLVIKGLIGVFAV
jgi:hypothetical protein